MTLKNKHHDSTAASPSTRPSIVEKIRRALALADDQSGTPEGETAARIARNMMERHALAMADLSEVPADDPMIEHVFRVEKRNQWRRNLAISLADHCEVFGLFTSGTNRILLYGRQSGVEVAEYLYNITIRQVEQQIEQHLSQLKQTNDWVSLSAGSKRSLRNSFASSAASAIDARLREMRNSNKKKDPTGTALMKTNQEEAMQWAKSRGVKWRSGPSSRVGFSPEGYAAGKSVSLSLGVHSRSGAGRRPAGLLGCGSK